MSQFSPRAPRRSFKAVTQVCALIWVVTCATLFSPQARAQDWSFIASLVAQTLDVRPGDRAPLLFSDHPDPGTAQTARIFHYHDSRSGGNALGLNVGLFRREAGGWVFVSTLPIFGTSPRDARFSPGRIDIATMTLGPNDPRCCPTQVSVWTIDTRSGSVMRR